MLWNRRDKFTREATTDTDYFSQFAVFSTLATSEMMATGALMLMWLPLPSAHYH